MIHIWEVECIDCETVFQLVTDEHLRPAPNIPCSSCLDKRQRRKMRIGSVQLRLEDSGRYREQKVHFGWYEDPYEFVERTIMIVEGDE
jgi:hypothetical protein